MAEQIPYGVAVSLINKLASSAFREFGRIYGVMYELENLKQTLESIKVVLSDAEQRQDQDSTIEHWISRFKEVLHDADDLFDDLAIKELRGKVTGDGKVGSKVRDFFSSENHLCFRAKLARKIEKIRKKFNHVAEDMSKLKLNSSTVVLNHNEGGWRETGSSVSQSDIIGREENRKEITDLLKQTHTDQNVSLIAIVGMGGLGKTALAQLVYNDAKEQELFQKYMWVCISEDFEVKTVLNKMLKSLKKNEVGDLEVDILQQKLREELNGQRYVLVLDDVWNEKQLKWNDLRSFLMCGGNGSKILVTTRSTVVSQTMGIKTPYVLKGLTKEQSWTLLKNVTFGKNASRMSPNLESIGEKIAEKCGGVPLAIRTIGGFLQTMNERESILDQWSSILHDDIWGMCKERESIMPVLKLSYQKLPLELRQCFALCCLYPKDWEIEKDELIQLWMAQGYLESSNERQRMEDVGYQYVEILLKRSFFQDASIKYNDIRSFKMHDLMHDLAKSVAGNDCCLDGEGKGMVGRPMHVSLASSTVRSLDSIDASRLRTILKVKTNPGYMQDEFSSVSKPLITKNLKHLHFLDLSVSPITMLPESIDELKHLRYLDLSHCNELISLPKSIGNLVCLQTLKLYRCRRLEFCVEVITKLISLRHLDIRNCKAFEDMMPAGIGKLNSLQYLSNFVVGDDKKGKSGKLNELKELNNIRGDLEISNLSLVKDVALESQDVNMKEKKYIQSLELYWGRDLFDENDEIENKNSDSLQLLDNLCPHQNLRELWVCSYPGVRFSSWLPSLTNIIKIYLYGFSNCQHLPSLERLPYLKTLQIFRMKELEYIHYEEISDVFFPSLEFLKLGGCENLRGWLRLGDDIDNHLSLPPFPRLSHLDILECPNLTCMPTFPHLVDKLALRACSVKPLIETCMVQLESSSFYPLSDLKNLDIAGVTGIEEMPEDWMQNLKSLEYLFLAGSSIIPLLLRHLQHLPSQLQKLEILGANDNKLDLWKDEDDVSAQCQAPLHCLRSLQEINISYSDNLKALPEQICHIQSLRCIHIRECSKLEALPEGMRCLTNLQRLYISQCPLLHDRCQRETGQDWPKIAHIPDLYINLVFEYLYH